MVSVSFLDTLKEKVILFDGAMGSNIQALDLSADDFGGEKYAGCNEHLVITLPRAIEKIHADFLEAGCDVVETDSFGSTSIVLAEYGLALKAFELNFQAASLARKVASDFSTASRHRFVAGSMGPTTKLPSLGHIGFKDMEEAYSVQARGLVEGGADLLVVETCQDVLQTKAALCAIFGYFSEGGRKVPVIASVTIEASQTMLLGTEIAAALTALEPYEVDLIGINCATGPKEMSESVRYLCANSPKPVFVMPNAGIPENVGGRAKYKLTPEEFVYYMAHFVKDLGVGAAGGCCGTTKEHIRKLADALGSLSPKVREWNLAPACSSLYQSVPLHIDPAPVLVGERTNANGSKQFKELLSHEDWEGMVGMGKQQVREGAHILDVCAAYVGRDEVRDIREIIPRFNTQVSVPLMIDSTEPAVIEESLQRLAGRAIVNSVNLEDGGERMEEVLRSCKKYGAAVIALTIDEAGMAKTKERKFEVASRIHKLATAKYGLRDEDLIFDTLTFTLGSGDEEYRKAAMETLSAIRIIKEAYPRVHTSLGVSNISFGLSPEARHVLNSVFLHYAIEYGLDLAIVNASKILPLYKINEREREISRKLIFDERTEDYDPLQDLLKYYAVKKSEPKKVTSKEGTIEERLKKRIIDGDRTALAEDLDEARKKHEPLRIINEILLDGMKVVGDLFGSGEMQLPFVLQSAEVMKAAVAYLEKFMEKREASAKGTIVLATVKGDVHDIGKNLVDIILTNNGYRVINLGIQCPLDRMLKAASEYGADAIGMSGLLVKSTLVMKENLEVMNERGVTPPVILGGAALTRRYVEEDLRNIYKGELFYANDAFDGLHFMERLASRGKAVNDPVKGRADSSAPPPVSPLLTVREGPAETPPPGRTRVAKAEIPKPPFYGARVRTDIPLDDIFSHINEAALIRGQWQFRKGKMKEEDYKKLLQERVYPELESLKAKVKEENLLEPKVLYGYFPCLSEGNDLIILKPKNVRDVTGEWDPAHDLSELTEVLRFSFPRQKKDRSLCISDFFSSRESAVPDVVAFQLVTVGSVASEYSHRLLAADDYKEYLYFHGLSVESAEALAELWHKIIRQELGISGQDSDSIKKLFSQQYRGARYSFGYPACPRLEDQAKLFELLKPERIGVSLTEGYQLVPEQSTSAIIVHHPEAKYFNI